MAVTSYKFPGTTVSETISGGNSTDWTNPNNTQADDTSYAVWDVSTASSDIGPYLKATNFGFTTGDIPSGSTIDGIEVEYGRFEGSGTDNITTARCRIVKGGSIHTANVSTMNTAEWNTSLEVITEGGSANLWGLTWLDTDIVGASTFGVAISPDGAGTTPAASLDYIKLRVYYTAPAGDHTIDGGAGSYPYTGSASSLEFGAEVTGEAGAYAYSGSAASLESAAEVNADAGAYPYTGAAASLESAAILGATAGAYAYSGSVATLEYEIPISAEAGAYAYSGADASLESGAEIAAGVGAYAYTGTATSLELAAEVNADAGAYAYIGTDTTLSTAVTISAEAGAYAYSGAAASLESSYEVNAEAGAYSYSGATAGLELGALLDGAAGAYDYSGATVSLEASFVISAESGAYGYTGKDVDFIYAEVDVEEVEATGGYLHPYISYRDEEYRKRLEEIEREIEEKEEEAEKPPKKRTTQRESIKRDLREEISRLREKRALLMRRDDEEAMLALMMRPFH